MAWSTTVSTSPFSGLNMTIVARYDFSSKEIFRLNIFLCFKDVFDLYFMSIYFVKIFKFIKNHIIII